MDRAEATGFGVATAGHLALLGALSLGFANAIHPPIMNPPMEVSFVEEVGLESSAPVVATTPPAPKLGEIEGPVEDSAPTPEPVPQPRLAPPEPALAPKPRAAEPKPAPKAADQPRAKPKAKPAPKKEATKSSGRLDGLLAGIGDRVSDSRSTAPVAKTASAAVKSSLQAEVRRQLKPHWRAPTGADAELLRTELAITLAPNGAVTDIEVLRTTGQTDSNRPQVKLHQEQAIRAVRLAAPFKLPGEYYDAWKLLSPIGFDKRLSQ
jgi:outer membrane biosynthesis protein TonB